MNDLANVWTFIFLLVIAAFMMLSILFFRKIIKKYNISNKSALWAAGAICLLPLTIGLIYYAADEFRFSDVSIALIYLLLGLLILAGSVYGVRTGRAKSLSLIYGTIFGALPMLIFSVSLLVYESTQDRSELYSCKGKLFENEKDMPNNEISSSSVEATMELRMKTTAFYRNRGEVSISGMIKYQTLLDIDGDQELYGRIERQLDVAELRQTTAMYINSNGLDKNSKLTMTFDSQDVLGDFGDGPIKMVTPTTKSPDGDPPKFARMECIPD